MNSVVKFFISVFLAISIIALVFLGTRNGEANPPPRKYGQKMDTLKVVDRINGDTLQIVVLIGNGVIKAVHIDWPSIGDSLQPVYVDGTTILLENDTLKSAFTEVYVDGITITLVGDTLRAHISTDSVWAAIVDSLVPVQVDGITLELLLDTLRIKGGGVGSLQIGNDAIGAVHIDNSGAVNLIGLEVIDDDTWGVKAHADGSIIADVDGVRTDLRPDSVWEAVEDSLTPVYVDSITITLENDTLHAHVHPDTMQMLEDTLAQHRTELDALNALGLPELIEGYHIAYVTNEKEFSAYDTLLFQTTTDTANTVPNSPTYLRLRAGTKTVDPDSGIFYDGLTFYSFESSNEIYWNKNDSMFVEWEFYRTGDVTANERFFSMDQGSIYISYDSDSTLRFQWFQEFQPTGTFERGVWHTIRVVRPANEDSVIINGQKFGLTVASLFQNLPRSTGSASPYWTVLGGQYSGGNLLNGIWIRNFKMWKTGGSGVGVQEMRYSPSAMTRFTEARKGDTGVTVTQDQSYLGAYNIAQIDFTAGTSKDMEQTEIYLDCGVLPTDFISLARDAFYLEYKITGNAGLFYAVDIGKGLTIISDSISTKNSWQASIIRRDRLNLGAYGTENLDPARRMRGPNWDKGTDRIEVRIIAMGTNGGQVLIKNFGYRYLTKTPDVPSALQTGTMTHVNLSTPILSLATTGDLQYETAGDVAEKFPLQVDSILAIDAGVDFMISPGDNTHNDSTLFWQYWDTLNTRGLTSFLLTTVGNHDDSTDIGGSSKKSAVNRMLDSLLAGLVTAGQTLGVEHYTIDSKPAVGYAVDLAGDNSIWLIGFDVIISGTAPNYFFSGNDTTWIAGKIDSILALDANAIIFVTMHPPVYNIDGSYPAVAGMNAVNLKIFRTMLADKGVRGVFSGHKESNWATTTEEGGVVYVTPSQLQRRALGWQSCFVDVFASGYVRYSLEWFTYNGYAQEIELNRQLKITSPINNRPWYDHYARNIIQKP